MEIEGIPKNQISRVRGEPRGRMRGEEMKKFPQRKGNERKRYNFPPPFLRRRRLINALIIPPPPLTTQQAAASSSAFIQLFFLS